MTHPETVKQGIKWVKKRESLGLDLDAESGLAEEDLIKAKFNRQKKRPPKLNDYVGKY